MTTTGATQHQLCRPVAAFLFFEYCANQRRWTIKTLVCNDKVVYHTACSV